MKSDSDKFDDESYEFKALIEKIFGRGKFKYKIKLPIIFVSCKKVGHIAARCLEREDKDERKGKKITKEEEMTKNMREKI